MTDRDLLTRDLLDTAAQEIDVDLETLWQQTERRLGTRRPWLRPTLGAASVVAVAGAAVATGWWTARPDTTSFGSGTASVSSATTQAAATSTATTSTASASTTSSASSTGPVMPGLTIGSPLPAYQQYVDQTKLGRQNRWAHMAKGRTIGLGTVHVGGRPANILLAPAMTDAGSYGDGKARPAGCVMVWPANRDINDNQVRGSSSTCVTFPLPTAKPGPFDDLGEGALSDPSTNEVDEYRDVLRPVVATSERVASVDFEQDGVLTPLPYRLTLPGVDGAVFVGFLPYRPMTQDSNVRLVARDAAGRVVFDRRL